MSGTTVLHYVSAAFGGALALATLVRAGRSVPRWALFFGMAFLSLESVLVGFGQATSSPAEALRWQDWRLLTMAMLPSVWMLFSLTYARGKETSLKASLRYIVGASLLLPMGIAVIFREQLAVAVNQTVTDAQWLIKLGWAGTVVSLLFLVSCVWILVNLERTFRASVGTMRWRIKFMLLGVGVLFVVRIYSSSQILLYRGVESSLETINSGTLIIATVLMLRSFFRTGHFDLEVYPSQSVLQNSFTVLIAGAYLLIVGLLAKVVTYFGADSAFAPKAFLVLISLVILTIALQSDRVRLQMRQFVSRHFHRSPYDYRLVWKTFTEGTASRVEQLDLCRGLVKLTADVFQALSVSIWLVDDKKEALILGASTASQAVQERSIEDRKRDVLALVKRVHERPEPFDLDAGDGAGLAFLREYHPTQFANGGNRVCIAMVGRGELLGVIVVGDRVGGVPFSVEDFDMLKCIGDHAAASLLNVQLSKKLLQAKELEAFQAMAAFFVHDLKNSASTLNLMLQNLPIHYDDPEFRADALRGISKTVNHINRLISRLGSLRHELKVELVESDLNEMVNSVLLGVERSSNFVLTKDLGSIPPVALDRDQIIKVITNLVLNATEAVPPGGQVQVTTKEENGWVVLIVADTGCGMSADFLNHSLFRPFQTTKKNGLGIGMFQSKMIVEAHGGRVVVSSEPGKGSTFRVLFRASAPR